MSASEHEGVLEFIRHNGHAVLATRRQNGSTQLSPVVAAVDGESRVVVSTQETAVKTANLRRHPHAALCVFTDGFFGEWHTVEGPVEILSLPDAMEPLVEYYRARVGEHPDWDDYRQAMTRDRRVLVRLTVERSGPTQSG
jgi:PPOX class probable F420-dependent enzyme